MVVLTLYPYSRLLKLISMLSPLTSGILVAVQPLYTHYRAVKLISLLSLLTGEICARLLWVLKGGGKSYNKYS